jgi:hypothetical protein
MKKARRIKVPDDLYLLSAKKLRSHWEWYWKHHHKDTPKKIRIDIDKETTE